MISTRFGIVAVLACAGLGLFAGSASAQTNYTWNNTGIDVGSTSSWTPTGYPGITDQLDNAFFNVLGTFGTSAQFNPDLTSLGGTPAAINQTTLNSTANFTGWTFTGTGGTIYQAALTTSGPVTHVINGPTISGIPAALAGTDIPLVITVTNGSTLAFQGASTFTGTSTTAGNINIDGGRLVLDNSSTNVANRLPTTDTIKQQGGGVFQLIGGSSGGTYNVGLYNTADNSVGGVNTISVTPTTASANTVLNFANTGTFSLRQGTRNMTVFQATSGELGSTNGPHITFTGTPFTGVGGLLTNTAGGSTPGWAIVQDSLGTNFATYSGTSGVGVVSIASANQSLATITTTTSPTAGSTTTNFQFNAPASTVTPGVTVAAASLRISPTGPGGVLAMGTNALSVPGIMLDGTSDYSITGTGTLFNGTHYIYVNNPNTTLNLSLVVSSAADAFGFGGPGFLNLTGTSNQNNATTQRIGVYGGVLRANNTQIGFSGSSQGILNLMGGVLEIKNGTNGAGASADFTRPLGATATATSGVVDFNSGTAEQGSGGFSAFGSNASVNIGGAGATLTWNQANFVGTGYALKFGSTQSNAVLQWQNPLALDGGTAGTYLAREINVTAGTGGDKTQMLGAISGSSSTDLLKTGTGTLELLGMNSYQGNTLIQGGTLIVGSGGSLGTNTSATGNIVVGNGATFAGVTATGGGTQTIFGASGTAIIVNPGGAIRGGNPTFAGDALSSLTTNTNITINSSASANGILRVEAARTGTNTANSSLIGTTGIFNLNPGSGNKFTIDLVNNAANPLVQGENYSITLANAGSFQLNGATLGAGASIAASNFTLQSSAFAAFSGVSLTLDGLGQNLVLTFTPVPEPGAVLAIAVGALGLGGLVRRRLRRVVPTIAA